jgi:SAM-dependent methyltransferase
MERLTVNADDTVRRYHEARYEFARPYAPGKDVLDVACGDGYGSAMLAEVAASITSVDPRATIGYPLPNVVKAYVEELTFFEMFDLVVSFETIEHIISPVVFLQKMWNALRPNGMLILSFPNDWGETIHHLHNTSAETLGTVQEFFRLRSLLGQNRRVQPSPLPIEQIHFWVENIVLVAEKRDDIVSNASTFEEIYNATQRRQSSASRSFEWKLRQFGAQFRTFLKRRGICRKP